MSSTLDLLLAQIERLKFPLTVGTIGTLATLTALYWKNKPTQVGPAEQAPTEKKPIFKLDKEFVARLRHVLRTGMPSIWCRETFTAALLALTLISRTAMTVWINSVIGAFVHTMCARDWIGVRNTIIKFSLVAIPATVMNAALRLLTQALKSNIREKISLEVHQLYLKNMNYYKVNKVGSRCLENADQLIAEDIEKFSDVLAEIYSNLLKPIVDFILFSVQLRLMLGTRGPVTMMFWFSFASWVSSIVLPSFGRLAVQSQKLEGSFRARHVRVIDCSEMIAFNGGEKPEKKLLDSSFADIEKHERKSRWQQLFSNIIMNYLNKYTASSIGLALVCAPVYLNEPAYQKLSPQDIASFYVESTRVMAGQAEAVIRLFEVQKLIGKLGGLTFRVWSLINALENPEKLELPREENNPPLFLESDTLSFKNVSIYRPDGNVLLRNLTFSVPPGTRIIITGENGVGKSSLFRVLRGLWPLAAGTIESPPRGSLKTFYFLSQDNFVPIGSLRDIIIYPSKAKDMKAAGKKDEDLWTCLQWANLSDLKINGLKPTMDTVTDWDLDLSPGQKQRMAFARLLYHSPKYAILDDCTNGVAPDVEMELYNQCFNLGISALTISHKSELKKLHDFELHFDGKGGYKLIKLDNPSQ